MPLVPLLHLFWRPLCIKILFMMSAIAKHDIAVSPCHKIHICLSPDYSYCRTEQNNKIEAKHDKPTEIKEVFLSFFYSTYTVQISPQN